MRHKRYAKQVVLEQSEVYLGATSPYAEALKSDGRPLQYDLFEGGTIVRGKDPLPALAPSTLWRWLSWLGAMPRTLRAAWKLIRERDPEGTLHREVWALLPRNCRSEQRRVVLQRAMQLIVANRLLARLFGQEMFPHFAIAHGWS